MKLIELLKKYFPNLYYGEILAYEIAEQNKQQNKKNVSKEENNNE